MPTILQQLADPVGWLVLAGGGLQASAHLFRSQVVLRMVLLAGTVHYLAYYFAASDQPLWPAILATSVITISSLVGLGRALGWNERGTPRDRAGDDTVQAPQRGTLRAVEK